MSRPPQEIAYHESCRHPPRPTGQPVRITPLTQPKHDARRIAQTTSFTSRQAAGRQAQVGFAEFRFPWGKRYALLVVLGYSRLLWCRFYPRQDIRTLIDGLEDAFRSFGGVPQELLFD